MSEQTPGDDRVSLGKGDPDPSAWSPAPEPYPPPAAYPPPTQPYPTSAPWGRTEQSQAPYGTHNAYGQNPLQPLVTIGDITCTERDVITPSGTIPISQSRWVVTDMSTSSERMSQTGIVLAIIGFFVICFLALLFLLMKERKTTGYVQVTVTGPHGFVHVSNIPANSEATMIDVSNRVGYARMLSSR